MRKLLVCLVLVGSLVSRAQSGSVAGEWRGVWTSPSGLVYSAAMTLEAGPGCKTCAVMSDGSVRGRIVWTLRKAGANAPDLEAKIGMTGTEFVRGQMKGDGLLVLNGYRKDDPNSILNLDQYRLALADNGQVLGGITWNKGAWTGQFIAMHSGSDAVRRQPVAVP